MHKCGVDGHIDNLLMILSYLRLNELTTNQVNALLNTIDKSGDTPLMLAAKNSRKELVQFLCECSEVELNEGDSFGMTALQHAINSGDKSMITSLSSAGASLKPINRHDDENESNCFIDACKSMTTMLTFILAFISVIWIVSKAAPLLPPLR